ncbi:MAG: metallophosphoesterase family protein [Dehalococcoidia bacterium]|nr:metallophosphoesterase family protein [Dehalococcoidia bacterium]
MLIGILSDTHIPTVARALPSQVQQAFRNVDMILHAGDIFALSVLDELERYAPVLAASGDDDDPSLNDRRVKERHILDIEGFRICLLHQMPPEVFRSWMFGADEMAAFRDGIDVLVTGHSHKPAIDRVQGMLLVSPGSATLPNYELRPGTVALLQLAPGHAEAQIVDLARVAPTKQ